MIRALKDAAAVIHESPSALQVINGLSNLSEYIILIILMMFSVEIPSNFEFNQRREEFNNYISVSRGYFRQLDER